MGARQKNVTFSLPEDVVNKMRVYVEDNDIPSLNAGVKEALEEYIVKLDRLKFRKAMEQASKDPLFIKDIENTMAAFKKIDSEIAGGSEEW
jgi:Arc/MetJ-type ribon-helix-helix transcriptional regulator